MQVLVIPDIHLKPYMFRIAEELLEKGCAGQTVCLMDIPDDWGKEYNIELYAETFDAAITFSKKYPDTLWVYGNHDLSYIWNERESGYSVMAAWTVRKKLLELKRALPEGNEMKYIHIIDNVLFCHGGVMDYFVENIVPPDLYHNAEQAIDFINGLDHDSMWNDMSPVWYRPQYSKRKLYKSDEILQVVGHTPVEHIFRSGNIISCDVFSTYRNGEPIGTQEFLVIDTKTWRFHTYRSKDVSR